MGVAWQMGAEGSHLHHLAPLKQLAIVVVLVQEHRHREVVHHNDIAHQGWIMYHNQKSNLNWICSMVVHMPCGVVSRRTVEEEEDRWGPEMVADGHWEGNSEEEHKVAPQHGDSMKIVVVVVAGSWMDAMVAAAEVDEVAAEGTGDVGSVDIVDVAVPRAEGVAAEIKAVGIADLVLPEVGSTCLSGGQLESGSESIGLEFEPEVVNPVVEVH